MKVYAVFREGIYRHECGGIFNTLDAAKARTDELACADVDDYHTYEVRPFLLDEPVEYTNEGWGVSPKINEAPAEYSVRRKKQEDPDK